MNYEGINDYDLIYKIREHNDENAFYDLVKKYEPIIINCAKKYYLNNPYYGVDLNDYIYKLCGEDNSLMPMMGSQIKKMKEENGYKASSILATLKYMYELKDPPLEFNPDYGVHDVIYFYH